MVVLFHLRNVSDLFYDLKKNWLSWYVKDVVLHCSIFFKWNKIVRVRWSLPKKRGSALIVVPVTWWRHQMETFSALLTISAENSPITGEFPAQRGSAPEWTVEQTIVRLVIWRYRAHYDVTVMAGMVTCHNRYQTGLQKSTISQIVSYSSSKNVFSPKCDTNIDTMQLKINTKTRN